MSATTERGLKIPTAAELALNRSVPGGASLALQRSPRGVPSGAIPAVLSALEQDEPGDEQTNDLLRYGSSTADPTED